MDNNEIKKIELQVPAGIRYISEWSDFNLDEFSNRYCSAYIIDKKIPGCGFTEYCLTCDDDIILCSPRKMLLANKESQHPGDIHYVKNELEFDPGVDIDMNNKQHISEGDKQQFLDDNSVEKEKELETLGIKDKMRNDLVNYIHIRDFEKKPCKIIVTYDSFKYVKEFLEEEHMFDKFKIVVDEFQSIFVDSRFKASTEFEFFNILTSIKNKNICFVSATPMIDKYLSRLDYFKNLNYYVLDWATLDPSRTIQPELKVRKMQSLTTEIKKVIQSYLDGKFAILANPITGQPVLSKEAVFYLNSVNDILKIIKSVGLTPDQVNILCSDTAQNRKRVRKKLGKKHQIGFVPLKGEPHKMFTFCTRTVYLGADFYSTNARTFIFSNANIDSLSVDISLDLPQILGRQRLIENPWKNHAEFFFKPLGNGKELTLEYFISYVKNKTNNSKDLIDAFNNVKDSAKPLVATKYLSDIVLNKYKNDYVSINHINGENRPVFNDLVMISEERAFDIQQIDYKNRFTVFNVIKSNSFKLDEISRFIEYLRDPSNGHISERLRILCETKKFTEEEKSLIAHQISEKFDQYYNLVGPKRCAQLGYYITDIKREVNNLSIGEDKIKELFYSKFKVGDRISNVKAKEIVREIYNTLKLDKTPKATDIGNYFEINKQLITDPDTNMRVNGIVIKNIKL